MIILGRTTVLRAARRLLLVGIAVFLLSNIFEILGPFVLLWGQEQVGSAAPLGVAVTFIYGALRGLLNPIVASLCFVAALILYTFAGKNNEADLKSPTINEAKPESPNGTET